MPSGSASIEIDLPVDVRALIVRGDEETRRAMSAVIVEPVSLVAADARVTDLVARRAVNYGAATVFFMDEGCFPEPEAFWLGGARQGTFVVQSATAGTSVPLQLRNAPVENTVTLVSGQWRESLTLAPGEERRVEIPLLPGRTSIFLKRSLLRIPILGYGMKLAGFIPVARKGDAEAAKQSVDAAAREMSRGVHITSFVEGTRSPDGRLLPFKKGPFYLAMETCAPVVPITIRGTEKLMPKGSLRLHPGTVRVIFHPPLDPANYSTREDLMEAVRNSIASSL